MIWNLITVGKPALPWAKAAAEDYLTRLERHQRIQWTTIKEGPEAVVTKRMLEASQDSLRVVLDERGTHLGSRPLAQWVQRQELAGIKRVSLLIGGANGHHEELRAAAQEKWALSKFTLQHEVALVVLLEQIYRAYTIIRGEPYHRD
jgi:23S rRNA (pseudouridine1915-N3)-methyltransferase